MFDLILLFFLLILSGFFSGSETALTTLSMMRVESLHQEGRRGSKALLALKSNNNRMLIALLIGNNLVNIGASAIATVLATKLYGHLGPGLAVGGLTVFILIFGEVTPKTFASRHAAAISLFAAPPVLIFSYLVMPLAWILEQFTVWLQSLSTLHQDPMVTESELINMARHGAREGTIEQHEEEMIERIFAFDTLQVSDVMIPARSVFSLPGSISVKESLSELPKHPHSRFLLHGSTPDDINKIVYVRDVLAAINRQELDKSLDDLGHVPLFVPENQKADELFNTLRNNKEFIAIVVDPFGAFRGICTLEDLLEELVGEIYDEKDKGKKSLRSTRDGLLLVSGVVEVRQVAEHFTINLNLEDRPTLSVSEWILNVARRIPIVNESFLIDGLTVRVEKASVKNIEQVSIALHRPDEGEEDPSDKGENKSG